MKARFLILFGMTCVALVSTRAAAQCVTASTVFSGNELQLSITNGGSASAVLTALQLNWPAANGKLQQVKLDTNLIYGNPAVAPPMVTLTTAKLVADPTKRTIAPGTSRVLHVIFQHTADTTSSNYSGTSLTAGSCTVPMPQPSVCYLGYPFPSIYPNTSVVFNESAVLQAFDYDAVNGRIRLFASDEHAPLLGVRSISGDGSVSSLPSNPGHVSSPAVGNTSQTDPLGRPIFPSLFVTDITGLTDTATHTALNYRAGDWQFGGTPIPPDDIFGTWKAASRSAAFTLVTDADPAKKNGWTLGPGSDTPVLGFASLTNAGYGTEVRWNVSKLGLTSGRTYRFQIMVHDGDQNQYGGDVGQACMIATIAGGGASD